MTRRREANATPGPLVAPGTYVVRLVAGGRTLEQKVEVREDPRIDITPAERKQWTDAVQQAAALAREFGPVNDRIQKLPGTGADVVDLKRQSRELLSRISGLYGALGRWTGAPTKDQTEPAGVLPADGEDAGEIATDAPARVCATRHLPWLSLGSPVNAHSAVAGR